MKLNLGAGAHPLDGFANLDPSYEEPWRFQDGIYEFADGAIDGITVSHSLMYVPLASWPFVFAEFARVLKPHGVVRITEDATDDPHSERYGGFHDAATLTSFALVDAHLRGAGLRGAWMPPDESLFKDKSLCQAWHGAPPKVFFIEGVKP